MTLVDVYDVPQQPAATADAPPDASTDDRLAEEFKREFMDAMAARHKRRRPATSAARSGDKKKKPDGDVLKGPKLGGSRNVRSQMRDILLKKEKESMGKR